MRLRKGFSFCMVLVVSGFLTLACISRSEAVSFTPLGDLAGGGFFSMARGLSGDGSVVVGEGNSFSGTEASRWTSGGGMVGLGDLPGGAFSSEAYGASGDGSVVVGESRSSTFGMEAFRWRYGWSWRSTGRKL